MLRLLIFVGYVPNCEWIISEKLNTLDLFENFLISFPFLSPTQYPATCGTAAVTGVCDITVGYDSTRPPHYKPVRYYPLHTLLGQVKPVLLVSYHYTIQVLPVDPSSQMIMFTLDNNCEFTLRTSGTEPKIKYYVYMFSPPGVQ